MRNTSNSKGSGSEIENRRHFFPSHSTPAARAFWRASYKLQRDQYVFTKRSNLHSELGSFDLRFLPRHGEFQTVD